MKYTDNKKLCDLAESEGYAATEDGILKMLEKATFDSVSPSICMNEGCSYTDGMEPDQDRGYCEECQANTMKSCLILAGII